MKIENLKRAIDQYVEDLAPNERQSEKGEYRFRNQLKFDIKEFAAHALEGMLAEVGMYGTRTHSYDAAKAFLIQFRNEV